ncbi:hypothetical protein MRB53_036903 [Persea americana]|nr:hypothetical protein MRB53_036903 [Persea americana]
MSFRKDRHVIGNVAHSLVPPIFCFPPLFPSSFSHSQFTNNACRLLCLPRPISIIVILPPPPTSTICHTATRRVTPRPAVRIAARTSESPFSTEHALSQCQLSKTSPNRQMPIRRRKLAQANPLPPMAPTRPRP